MIVAEAVGRTLAQLGAEVAFGVVGSGNFHITNALVAQGCRFVAARHESGATTMADAYARTSGKVGIVTLHQGCGLTNAMTGITEAAKSRTPLVAVVAEAMEPRSNFNVDQQNLAYAVDAVPMRIDTALSAVSDTVEAYHRAYAERRTVLLNVPLGLQGFPCEGPPDVLIVPRLPEPLLPPSYDIHALADLLDGARPVFVAGRGARSDAARAALEDLADQVGALLTTSAVAKGLFQGNPWYLDVSGGFASPLAAELIAGANVIVGWGCTLNMWTMRHGKLIGPQAKVIQVDLEREALGAARSISFGVTGDVAATARAVAEHLRSRAPASRGYRSDSLRERIVREVRWRDVPYEDTSGDGFIDPRTLTIALDDLLPAERVIGVDSGNFMGYPTMYLSVPDMNGLCFTQAFQSVGLGLSTAIGAAVAAPDRLAVAALGDGGALMSAVELDTLVRLRLPMLVVVYNDSAYGAEVHHFGPGGHPLETVVFPETDIAAIGRGFGCDGVTVRTLDDLAAVRDWLAGPRERPLVVDAKVTRDRAAWWLEEAFRGH